MATILHVATAALLALLACCAVKELREDREARRRMKKLKRDIDRVTEDTRRGLDKLNELKRRENEVEID